MFNWFTTLISGKPHFVIGGSDPYLLRWFIIPRNNYFNIYLHKFLRDDDDRALHDHPWNSLSFYLWGNYNEVSGSSDSSVKHRSMGSVVFRSSTYRHRILTTGKPAWTLFVTGRKQREWGFWCDKNEDRFVVWHDFVDRDDHGSVGPGCGD